MHPQNIAVDFYELLGLSPVISSETLEFFGLSYVKKVNSWLIKAASYVGQAIFGFLGFILFFLIQNVFLTPLLQCFSFPL